MKRVISCILIIALTSVFLPVFADETEAEHGIAAGFSFYNANAVPQDDVSPLEDKDDGYLSTYGTDISSRLFLSVNGEKPRKMEWSDTYYLNGDREQYVPVMSAGGKNPWGEEPYIKVVFSAEGYTDLTFSAQLGGSSKAPSDCVLLCSTDDENYEQIGEYRIEKDVVMEDAFVNVPLPKAADNKSTVYVKILFKSPRTINGDEIGFKDSTSGRLAFNNIVINGTGKGVTVYDGIEVTPRPTPTAPSELYPKDVSPDREYYNQVMLLTRLGILDSEKPFYPSLDITYADFAEMLGRASGAPVESREGNITSGEAISITLDRLGYGIVLENVNETEYMIAKGLGLLSGITYKEDALLNSADACVLIHNALKAYQMKLISYGYAAEYAQVYENWLGNIFNVTEVEGVITDVPFYKNTHAYDRVGFTTVYGEEITAKGWDITAEGLVGHRSVLYIKDCYGDNPEFVFAYKSTRDISLTIKKGDFLGVTEVRDNSIVISYEDKTLLTHKAVVSRNADFVYNGAVSEQLKNDAINMAEDALKPSHIGNIELVDINDDEIYDYVFVTNYLDMYIEAIDYENYIVTNKLKYMEGTSDKITQYFEIPSLTLNTESDLYKVLLYKADGKTPAEFTDIKKGSVLSVAASEMNSHYDISLIKKVIICDGVVEGEVESILVEDGDAEYTISGNSYRFSKSYYKTYDRGNEDEITSVKVGDYGTFYLNYDERIVYADKTSPSEHYGLYTRAARKKGLTEDKLVQLVLQDGTTKVFQISDKQYQLWNLSLLSGATVVKYVTDKSGEKLLRLSTDPIAEVMGELQYQSGSNRLGNYFLTEKSKIFVFTSSDDSNRYDGEYYSVVPFDTFADKTSYMSVLYDLQSNAYPKAAVIDYDLKNAEFTNEKLMFVTKVSNVLDEEGFGCKEVTGFTSSGEIKIICDREIDSVPQDGTVIQFRVDADGNMIKFNRLCDDDDDQVEINTVFDDEYYALHSNITGITDDIITVKDQYDEYQSYKVTEDTKVVAIYTVADGKYSLSIDMFENITTGNKIFLHQSHGLVTEIFVWKHN